MSHAQAIAGIDAASWKVHVLPLPKRHSRGAAHGFCAGHPVGTAETARAYATGCWWPDGKPQLLELEGRKFVAAGRARGDTIPGHWRHPRTSAMKATAWRPGNGGLAGAELPGEGFEQTWATASAPGLVIGIGSPKRIPGERPLDVGLAWRDGDAMPRRLAATGSVHLFATDGTGVAGSIDGRAMWWPTLDAAPIELAPEKMPGSEVQALDGDLQAGVAFNGMRARAALWRGTRESFVDLTPAGFETGRAFGAARGWQVGLVRRKDCTRNGSSACDDRAVLWQGAADRWFDLNALLPAPYNASCAWSILVVGDEVRVCGEARRVEASDPGTARESHYVPVAHPVLWTARLAE